MKVHEAEAEKQCVPSSARKGQGQAAAVQGAGPGGHKDLGFILATAATDGGRARFPAGT